jgi:hypothetical protein
MSTKRKRSSSSSVEPQDDDSPQVVSTSLVETEDQHRKRSATETVHQDDVYAQYKLDFGSSQIRIFTLLPAEDRDAPLEGSLRVADLGDETTKYEALSYVWGEADNNYYVHMRSGLLRISTNLFGALRQLRGSDEPRHLWVDAMCIDQATTKEKNHQVQRMFDIYSRAESVVIWMGDADEDTDFVMSYLARQSTSHFLNGRHYGQLKAFFAKPWWRRIWTLQEGLAAKRDSLVICGSKAVQWHMILDEVLEIARHDTRYDLDTELSSCLAFLRTCAFSQIFKYRSLENLVRSSISRSAKDPRDYIYALLGPLKWTGLALPQADYAESMSWAYQRGMLTIMRDAGDLEFLLMKLSHNAPTKPSWCLDFSDRDLLEKTLGSTKKTLGSTRKVRYRNGPRFCMDPVQLFQLDPEKGTIRLIGRKIIEVIPSCSDDCVEEAANSKPSEAMSTLSEYRTASHELDRRHAAQSKSDFHRLPIEAVQAISHSRIREHDIVCKLYRLRKPIVLRPETDGSYTIVGLIERPAWWDTSIHRYWYSNADISERSTWNKGEHRSWDSEYRDEPYDLEQKLQSQGLAEGEQWFVIG